MKKIIDGKSYDTKTAKKVGYMTNGRFGDHDRLEETLYLKKTGEFFLHGEGGAGSIYREWVGSHTTESEKIIPFEYEDATEWSEKNLTGDEYEAIFGEVVDEESVTITLRTTVEVKEKFDEMKKEKGLTASELLEMLLNKK